jgi:membrane-bound serine protease (ClpP class)
MKLSRFWLALTILAALFAAQAHTAEPEKPTPADRPVYIISIKGMIERGLTYVIRRGLQDAAQAKAAAVVFDMDTPGGRVDAAERLIELIGRSPVPTYTFVNPNAISAGAIIAFSTDHIYMAPGSRIGDAMPIMMSPFGAPQDMPENIEEKTVSFVAGLIRSAAQRKGHDDQLAEAMVRREMEYKIGDDVISPKGQLLTLTNAEAERWVGEAESRRRLLSEGTVESIDELMKAIGLDDSKRVPVEISLAERIARYIEAFSFLFLAGGLLGLYIEFKTPGFGIPGITGILLLMVWFWGHHIAGLAGMSELLVFALGAALLMVEIFVTPGFGVLGSTGLILMVSGLLMAMVQHYPGDRIFRIPDWQIGASLYQLGLALGLTCVVALILARFLPRTHLFRGLMLDSAIDARLEPQQKAAPRADLLGLKGKAVTALHPAGIGIFDGRRLDVVAGGDYIEKGSPIVIADTHGNRIVVVRNEEA